MYSLLSVFLLIVFLCLIIFLPGRRLERAVSDFNETRSSDIFVVNFGAHYDDTKEDEEQFRVATAALLDDMARLGETTTMIWRYALVVGGIE